MVSSCTVIDLDCLFSLYVTVFRLKQIPGRAEVSVDRKVAAT